VEGDGAGYFKSGAWRVDERGERYHAVPEQTLRIKCPSLMCRKILAVPLSSRGKTVKCKSCGVMIRVPQKSVAPPPPPPGGDEEQPAIESEAA
jgi:hypothetical protein